MSEEEIIKEINIIKETIIDILKIDTENYIEDIYNIDTIQFKAIEGLLDLYNKEKLNSLSLSEQLNKEKEKNKELENCLQMAKQIMTADISEDFDCMKLKEFKEYLLNEIKLNENFEE